MSVYKLKLTAMQRGTYERALEGVMEGIAAASTARRGPLRWGIVVVITALGGPKRGSLEESS